MRAQRLALSNMPGRPCRRVAQMIEVIRIGRERPVRVPECIRDIM